MEVYINIPHKSMDVNGRHINMPHKLMDVNGHFGPRIYNSSEFLVWQDTQVATWENHFIGYSRNSARL